MRTLLDDIGWRQIDGDAFWGQCKTNRGQRRAHALLGFGDRLVGQPDNSHRRQTISHMHLNIDRNGVDASEGDGPDGRMHDV